MNTISTTQNKYIPTSHNRFNTPNKIQNHQTEIIRQRELIYQRCGTVLNQSDPHLYITPLKTDKPKPTTSTSTTNTALATADKTFDDNITKITNTLTNEIFQTVDQMIKDSFATIRDFLHEFFKGDLVSQSTDANANTTTNTKQTGSPTETTGTQSSTSGTSLKSNGEFLWKPESEKDGKLAILLPANISQDVKRVRILSPDKKKVVATGKYYGIGNGDRAHFRFSKAGAKYANNSKVEITMNNGTVYYVNVAKTGSRYSK